MNQLEKIIFDFDQGRKEMQEFKDLLKKDQLSERDDILPFFKNHMHLSAFIGDYNPEIRKVDRIKHEFSIAGEFFADLVVGDWGRKSFCFIEFEDGKNDSIYKQSGRHTLEWSPRFEHGFSQIVDWFWRMEDLKNTKKWRDVFGDEETQFLGMLILGRSSSLNESGQSRLRWRTNKVLIDSRPIVCLTYDQLAFDIEDKMKIVDSIRQEKPSS